MSSYLLPGLVMGTPNSSSSVEKTRVKAITYAIAVVMLIAITLILVAAFVSWVMGVHSSMVTRFMCMPYLRIRSASVNATPVLELHVINEGYSPVYIVEVEVDAGSFKLYNRSVWVVEPGSSKIIVIDSWNAVGKVYPLEEGDVVRVKVYTREYGMYIYDVVVSSG